MNSPTPAGSGSRPASGGQAGPAPGTDSPDPAVTTVQPGPARTVDPDDPGEPSGTDRPAGTGDGAETYVPL
jgi:hypothetical protein